MKTVQYLIILTIIFYSLTSFSKNEEPYSEVPFQLTFISPLGTNGLNSPNTINMVSVNILAGYHSGLTGVEFGGLLNLNRDFMNGVQFSGFSNINMGDATGVQFAGFSNVNLKQTDGAQFAGFANIGNSTTNGLQAAGFANLARRESKVVQLAGFGNLAHSVKGVQIAGFSNVASEKVEGVQIAGFGNIASEEVEGAQIAGFINIARKVKGTQIGVFNIADTITNGIPIGFLSIVRNGFCEFELGVSEGLNTIGSFKIGVKQFYNIFSFGMQYFSDRFRWAYGYGIGTHLSDHENLKVNLELMSYHINEGSWRINGYNGLQQVKLTFARPINDNLNVFMGPTFNLMVSDRNNSKSSRTGSDFPPYSMYNHWSGQTNLKYWVGFTAGIRIQ